MHLKKKKKSRFRHQATNNIFPENAATISIFSLRAALLEVPKPPRWPQSQKSPGPPVLSWLWAGGVARRPSQVFRRPAGGSGRTVELRADLGLRSRERVLLGAHNLSMAPGEGLAEKD